MGDLDLFVQERTLKYLEDQANLNDDCPPRPDEEPKRTSDKPSMPCNHSMNGRNLVVCIDGTANKFGEKNTNVIELYNLILKGAGDNQRTWYNSGIGTYARPSWKTLGFYKNVLYHKIDLAIAWDFERTVLGAYHWLSDTYEEGDCIFLFGFSRGAFQVRVLSAMIDKVGLVYKGNEMQIPFAYELYADPKSDRPTVVEVGSAANHSTSMADRFKHTFSNKDVRVHFVGAWDTVSSIGVARGKQMLPRTIDGMKHVCYFRHALALDERRVKFLPEYAYGGSAKPARSAEETEDTSFSDKGSPSNLPFTEDKDSDAVNDPQVDTGSRGTLPHTKEVWFAGTHSDIGGGNARNTMMDRCRPPLRWMVFEAGAAGLRTTRFKRKPSSGQQIDIVESLTWPWLFFEILPVKRMTFTRKENKFSQMTRKPHLGSGRKIHPGQKIHSSLLRADVGIAEKYTPKARPVNDDSLFWEELRNKGISAHSSEWLELDLYEHSRNVVEDLITEGDNTALQSLHHTAISGDARQAVYEKVIEALNRKGLTPEVKHRLLRSSMSVLKKRCQGDPDLKLSASAQIRPLLSDLWNCGNENYQKTAQDFVALFTDLSSVFRLPDGVLSAAVSPDGKHVVSAPKGGRTVQIWKTETRELVGKSLEGHRDDIRSVAFSPDGTRVASGSDDWMVRVWDVETGELVGEPFRGHTGPVNSVALSFGGKRAVSGSDDKTVRIWDVETGKVMGGPLQGHVGVVKSVAFSSDGTRVVSGSDDKTVRIWDVETGKPVGEPLQGHRGVVKSVAFSVDGKRVVSGSSDQTIRVWDAETGISVGGPLRGHTGWVNSVAFSFDGKRIVSGSDDTTVRIWDAETGRPVGEPLRGDRHWVISVAFSSDDRSVVSGSTGGTVQIWDLKAFEI